MRNTMANIWNPLKGAPWTFNNHLLIIHRIQENEDPMSIPLVYSDWWVQIHDLPPGFFRDSMAVQFGNFIGKYLEYDMK
ncbi:hypothetical protein Goarm_021529 [Gossypium armourianum]|uniref:DUF4283 domain-containing protein n=1 Tax=Gossypium armourianum TaxID=34283 RepID=A0A7J9IS14_9ROSI|nr:hypothetical protein [Gossypium armourianum]